MSNPTTVAELADHLNQKADDYERQADGVESPILARDLRAKAETARYAARLAAGIDCGKDAA